MTTTIQLNNVPVSLIDTGDLSMINNKFREIDTWLLDTLFPARMRFDGVDDIPVGELDMANVPAPYVLDCVEHQPIGGAGAVRIDYIKAAYLKPKETVTPCTVMNPAVVKALQAAGYISNRGELTPGDRLLVDQSMKFMRLRKSIDLRKLLMAVELMTTGQVVVMSDNQPRFVQSFNRSASSVFAPAALWSTAAATPVQDINTMLALANDLSGPATMILTTTAVWNALLKHQDFNDTYLKPYAGVSVPFTPGMVIDQNKPVLRGFLPNTNVPVYTYDAKYKLALGAAATRFLPNGFFGVISATGVIAQAQIKALPAFGQALDYFDSDEYKISPSLLHMYCESAPAIIPGNPNWVVGGSNFI
jgi:hypothetical protein